MPAEPAKNGHRHPAAAAPVDAPSGARTGDESELAALLRGLTEDVRARVHAAVAKSREVASLGLKRFKLRVVDGAFGAAWGVVALGIAATLAIAGALAIVQGFRRAIAGWTGVEWVGDLIGGLLAIALPVGGLWLAQRKTRRSMLARAVGTPAKPPRPATPAAAPSASEPLPRPPP